MFVGSAEISMDNKGRVIVPLNYREQFGEQIVVSTGPEKCLYLYTMESWQGVAEQLMALPDSNNPKLRAAKRFLFGNTFYCDIDKQGRILIPKKQREYAQMETEVVYVGAGKRIELWSKSNYEAPEEEMDMAEAFATFEISM